MRAQEIPRHSLSFSPVLGTHLLPENDHTFNDPIPGLDIVYGFNLRGKEDAWIQKLRAREFGLALTFRDLNRLDGHLDTSANSFGKAYGISASLEFELAAAGPVHFYLVPSVGLSYISKNYFTHPDNRFIGSHLNQLLKAALQMEVPLGENFSALANFHVLHLSNGGFNIPNSGINTGNISVGIKSRFGPEPYRKTRDNFTPLERNTFEVLAGIGRRGVYESHDGFFKSGLYAGYNYRLNEVLDLKAGLNAVYYYSVFDPQRHRETYQHYGTSYDPWRLGLSLGAAVKMSRFEVKGLFGRYLYYNSFHDIHYYWNSGLSYLFTPHLGLQSTLHMHRFQADFVDLGFIVKL
ncbi:acyloxyacyl hydrolase [Anseongella ginsenosidimutans]|uniref:acyloxyacyl hydrolase n=1 Tax=Anseongella ginsenosidimutans TaxID=496056 RepID=UPI00131523D2|nr:acyloxyacyl hydrolase [Anseongella ginsenosidimutans]